MTQPEPRRPVFRDPALQREFDRAGFVVLRALDGERVARLRARWSALTPAIHAWPFSASILSDDLAYRAAVDEAVGEAFEAVLAETLDGYRFSFGNYVTKRGSSPGAVGMHQDPSFVDESRYDALNFWTALSDVGRENGCLRLMPGSHLLNAKLRGTDRRFPWPELMPLIEERFLVDVPLAAGEACVCDLRTIHASYPNVTPHDRVCASAIAVPAESELWYCYQDRAGGGAIDVYRADDEYYRTHVFGSPPDGLTRIARVPGGADAVTPRRLAEVYANAVAEERAPA
ncbi:MAG TPA: phytanoyl-CoA dioxygenase family protein [Candidatus Elarobacter sp.]|nr:phytanoyl-CoA dioxygenase family protein [Candidatus Elarobacter sp.]